VVLPPAIRASTVSSASFAAKESPEACAVIETAPGEELQVDYGTGPMVRDPHTGKYRRTRLFVLTLGYSRKSVRFVVLQKPLYWRTEPIGSPSGIDYSAFNPRISRMN
jgi:hypothetical protein